MQNRRRSDKIHDDFALFLIAEVRTVELMETITLPLVPIGMGQGGSKGNGTGAGLDVTIWGAQCSDNF
jgi:hypothetical protein